VSWQGSSVGFDAGADGARTMMRFGGINGSDLLHWRLRHDGTYREQNCCGPNSIRHRTATWSQSRLPEVHRRSHVEPVLIGQF